MIGISKGQNSIVHMTDLSTVFFETFGMDQVGKSMNATGKSTLKYVKLPSCGEGSKTSSPKNACVGG